MANQKVSLKLDTKDVVFVKPSKPTPSSTISLSSIDNRPELNSLCQAIRVYQSPNNSDSSQNGQPDPALVIKEALSKALFYYYPLAGRLVKHTDGKLRIQCNADGVPFIEAIANCKLSSIHYLEGSDTAAAKQLAFDLPTEDENGYQYPVVAKVTKFLCGGFAFGIGASHAVCDGSGVSKFLHAIAELASGRSEPSVKPVWERERLIGSITKQPLPSAMDDASAAVSPYLPTKTLVQESFKVDSDNIRRLKLSLMKEISDNIETVKEESFTNFESLAAYVWRSRARALKLNYDGKAMLKFAVGVRRHLIDSPLPEGYYGNAIVDADAVLTVRELVERPLTHVVKVIRETKKVAFTKEFIKSTIDTLETQVEDFDFDGTGACMALAEWKHLGFLENVDFGWNEPVNIVPAPCNMFGKVSMCIFSPPSNLDPSMSGGIRVFVSLPDAAMPKFREEMEALRLITP